MANPIIRHLENVSESYGEHFAVASRFGLRMIAAGLACLVHAVMPFLFQRTASKAIRDLHGEMTERERRGHDDHWVI